MTDETGLFIGTGGGERQILNFKRANRHGLIAGATGTGKTVTLQGIAEGFSRAGVPVFVADVKGDLSGLAMAGSPTAKVHDAFAARGSGRSGSSSGDIDAGPDGGTCLGDEGAAPSCDNQTGCLTDDFHEDMCTGTASVFRPAVARQIVECLKIAPSCEMGEDESECAQKAVDEACPMDPAFVTGVCDNMIELAECVGDEADGFGALCDALVPALTQLGREGLAECVSNFGCTGSPCLDPSYANYSLIPSPPIE